MKGVPLAYDRVRIVGPQGDIYDDSGYVHMDIQADFIVFQPRKGQKLLVSFQKLQLLIDPVDPADPCSVNTCKAAWVVVSCHEFQ